MKKIIIDPGAIPVQEVKNIIGESLYDSYFIGEEFLCKRWADVGIKSRSFESFGNILPLKDEKYVLSNYNRVFNSIINDNRTPQLASRTFYHLKPWQDFFNEQILISNLVVNYLDYIHEIDPCFVFFHSTPHNIYSWTFGKVVELMNIPIYITKTSPLPWRSYLTRGMDEYEIIPLKNNRNELKEVEAYISLNSGNYEKAITPYEKKGLESRGGKFWSWKVELSVVLKSPHRIVALFRKRSMYKYFQKISSKEVGGKYVVVFLHFQPERSTLPEGYNFTQQLNLIRTLRLGLPDDVTVIVKEHPTVFTGNTRRRFDIRYRTKDFYSTVSELPNTKFIDLSIDSFSLIDKAIAVATITGTVGGQAMTRGVPVFAFGKASYINAPDCYAIYSSVDVQNAYNKIVNTTKEEVRNRTISFLKNIEEITVSGRSGDSSDSFHNLSFHYIASAKAFKQLMTNQDCIAYKRDDKM